MCNKLENPQGSNLKIDTVILAADLGLAPIVVGVHGPTLLRLEGHPLMARLLRRTDKILYVSTVME